MPGLWCESVLIENAAARLISMFDLCACWYEPFPFDDQLPRIETGRIVLPATEPGVAPWSCDRGVELPVRHDGLTLGRFVLIPCAPTVGVAFSPGARRDALARRATSANRSRRSCSPRSVTPHEPGDGPAPSLRAARSSPAHAVASRHQEPSRNVDSASPSLHRTVPPSHRRLHAKSASTPRALGSPWQTPYGTRLPRNSGVNSAGSRDR